MPPKRKSDASTAPASKKARKEDDNAQTVALIDDILANPATFSVPEDDEEIRKNFISLANYARSLQVQATPGANARVSAAKSPEELSAAVEKIRKAAVAGIKKQMNWRPTAKQNSAKWCYDGVCTDQQVFAALLGLEAPLKFKQKKMPLTEFENSMGDVSSSARYSSLYLTGSSVFIRWSDTGEFKMSGTYGVGTY